MPLHQEFLKILLCPECRNKVRLNPTEDALICDHCMLTYEIRYNEIPVMIREKARPLLN